MRVLHVIPSLSLVHGGPSRAIDLIERSIQNFNVEMEVATTDDDGPGKRVCVHQLNSTKARHYFPKRTEFYKISPAMALWLFKHICDYDVVHIHSLFSFSSLVAAWAAGLSGVPFIIRPLGTLSQYGIKKRRPWLKQISIKLFEGPILRSASLVHFTAEAERVEAEALGIPFRSTVIPLAVNSEVIYDDKIIYDHYPVLRKGRYLLFLSRLDPKKNVEGLLRALVKLSDQYPDLKLVVAGDGAPDYVSGLKQLAQMLGISSRVVWVGFIDGELKTSALKGAHVFVLPSYSENFGVAAAEALMAGLPCVLGQGVAIAAEVERVGAGVVVNTEETSIAEGVRHYLESKELKVQAGEAAVALANREFSLDTMGERLVGLYRSVCRSRKKRLT